MVLRRTYKRRNYTKDPNANRKRLLTILFILLASYYLGPKLKGQVSAVQLKSQYFKVYREFSQAVALYQYKDGEFAPSSYAEPRRFVQTFSSLFAVDTLCEEDSNLCLPSSKSPVYTTLDGKKHPKFLKDPNIGQFVLLDGTLVILNEVNGNLWVNVDINGIKRKPNKLGLDVFTFFIGSDESNMKLMGASGTPYMNLSKYCNPYTSNKYNGLPCSYKAILDKTYFEEFKFLLR